MEKLEWRVDLTQISKCFSIAHVLVNALGRSPAIHRVIVGIRRWFDPLFRELYLTTYISIVSLRPPNVVDMGSPCFVVTSKYKTITERERERENTRRKLLCFTLQKPRLYRSASEQLALRRLSRRPLQTCERVWIHARKCLLMRKRLFATLRTICLLPIDRKRWLPCVCIRPFRDAGYFLSACCRS